MEQGQRRGTSFVKIPAQVLQECNPWLKAIESDLELPSTRIKFSTGGIKCMRRNIYKIYATWDVEEGALLNARQTVSFWAGCIHRSSEYKNTVRMTSRGMCYSKIAAYMTVGMGQQA